MTEAEYTAFKEALEIDRIFPYAERHARLVALGGRAGADEVADVFFVNHLCDGGRYEEAETAAAQLRKDRPNAWSYSASSAAVLLTEGPVAALDFAEKALSIDANNPFALGSAYTAAWAAGKHQVACDYVRRLAQTDPSCEVFACSHITSVAACGNLTKARELLADASAVVAGSAASHSISAFIASIEGQTWLATDHATMACELEPNVVWHWLVLAEFLLKADRIPEAEEMAKRVLAINPRRERALAVLVGAAEARRDWDAYYLREAALDACTPYRAALEHCRAGERFVRRGEYEAAARAYLVSVGSNHAGARREARLGLIRVRLRQRRWADLVALLPEFESELPVPTIVVLARAANAARDRNWDEAIRLLEQVDTEENGESLTYWHLTYLWQAHRLARLTEVAISSLDRVGCSEHDAFYALLGLYRANENELGDEHLTALLERFPTSQAMKWLQARRLKATGDKRTARVIWRQLSPQMRRWNPDAHDASPALWWTREIGRQFRRRLLR